MGKNASALRLLTTPFLTRSLNLVDLRGFGPLTPCLQSTKSASNNSAAHLNYNVSNKSGDLLSLKANPNELKRVIPAHFVRSRPIHFTEWPGSLAAAQPSQDWA